MARHEDNDFQDQRPEPYVASQPKTRKGFGHYVLTLLIVFVGVFAVLYGVSYAETPEGQRFIAKVESLPAKGIAEIEDILWKPAEIAKATWTAEINRSNEGYGITFVNFQSVGSKKIPAGSTASFKYVVGVGAGVENINLNLDCKVDPKEVVRGDVSKMPKDTLKISTENPATANNLRCNFLTNDEIKEDRTVTVKGLMSFSIPVQRTSLKVYLLSSKEYEDLKGKDFFVVNNKQDKLPIKAVYNGEPVEVGIGVSDDSKQPVVIGSNYPIPLVGISLINKWDGKVTSIDSLSLILPDGVSIDSTMSPPTESCPFSDGIPYNKVVKYDADKDLLKNIPPFGSGESSTFQNFECWLKVDDKLVEGREAGLETAYHVDLGYSYAFNEKSDIITVVKRKSVPVPSEENEKEVVTV